MRGELTKLERATLSSLAVIDVHARDVVRDQDVEACRGSRDPETVRPVLQVLGRRKGQHRGHAAFFLDNAEAIEDTTETRARARVRARGGRRRGLGCGGGGGVTRLWLGADAAERRLPTLHPFPVVGLKLFPDTFSRPRATCFCFLGQHGDGGVGVANQRCDQLWG